MPMAMGGGGMPMPKPKPKPKPSAAAAPSLSARGGGAVGRAGSKKFRRSLDQRRQMDAAEKRQRANPKSLKFGIAKGNGWYEKRTADGVPYYHNETSGALTWDKPEEIMGEAEREADMHQWVWCPDDELGYVPARLIKMKKNGLSAEVRLENGETRTVRKPRGAAGGGGGGGGGERGRGQRAGFSPVRKKKAEAKGSGGGSDPNTGALAPLKKHWLNPDREQSDLVLLDSLDEGLVVGLRDRQTSTVS